jgi:A/G-specific adenine glycosylase
MVQKANRTRLNLELHAQLARALLKWFSANARELPWRRTSDPYAIWVSEIMLQQTQVKTVLPYYGRWMKALPNIRTLARAKSDKIHKLWEGLGYYTRVRNMQAAAQHIVDVHGGTFPKDYEKILSLKGIGRYTAGAICSIAFNQPAPILDGNVIRVLTRLFGVEGNPKERQVNACLWEMAAGLVLATSECGLLNQSLMELGALVCTPREPKCEICPVRERCIALRSGRVNELPALPQRVAATRRRFAGFVVRQNGAVLVRQRPAGVVNAHLWEFPNVELNGEKNITSIAQRTIGPDINNVKPLARIQHTITRYRITLEVYEGTSSSALEPTLGIWADKRKLRSLAFSSAHKKIASLLLQKPS